MIRIHYTNPNTVRVSVRRKPRGYVHAVHQPVAVRESRQGFASVDYRWQTVYTPLSLKNRAGPQFSTLKEAVGFLVSDMKFQEDAHVGRWKYLRTEAP